ncbi:MAG TPA: ABC transporter substrate-binding protein [Oscillatoriaceae cyanobacterium M33_DOE_052]|uniref:Transporter substrate-binding domain-containing protein n=1 Tax=Planktothricoides sp. SpSt-374 TaxID=2282167 RepID=A0A7C3VJ98_9CYAN|nr:ABC transporter substrate-binding protein [Oscillatoriaceae cyanobacterium M33_DOE_052]
MLKSRNVLKLSLILIMGFLLATFIHACEGVKEQPLKQLQIGITSWPGFDIALYGQAAGLFEKRGLAVEFQRFQNQQDSSRAVMRGSLDAAFVSFWDALQVDPGNDTPALVLVTNVSRGADGIVTQAEIKSVKELQGKKVAAKLGTVNHLILLEALNLHQVEPKTVEIEDISNEIAVDLLKQGKVDGAVLWEPLLSETAKEIKGNIPYTTKDLNSLVIDVLVTRSGLVKEKQAELTQFILAWFDIMHAVETNPTAVFAKVGEQLGQTGAAFGADYSGLKKGDIEMNRQMFAQEGGLVEAKAKIVALLREDMRHGRIPREDLGIAREPVNAALAQWQPVEDK